MEKNMKKNLFIVVSVLMAISLFFVIMNFVNIIVGAFQYSLNFGSTERDEVNSLAAIFLWIGIILITANLIIAIVYYFKKRKTYAFINLGLSIGSIVYVIFYYIYTSIKYKKAGYNYTYNYISNYSTISTVISFLLSYAIPVILLSVAIFAFHQLTKDKPQEIKEVE